VGGRNSTPTKLEKTGNVEMEGYLFLVGSMHISIFIYGVNVSKEYVQPWTWYKFIDAESFEIGMGRSHDS
jgi:hypothetical protein